MEGLWIWISPTRLVRHLSGTRLRRVRTAGGLCALYWLTGRSQASKRRTLAPRGNDLFAVDLVGDGGDLLRHYRAARRSQAIDVIGNGVHVDQVFGDMTRGSTQTLPLLLDDFFVRFDDERTRAGIVILEEMSSKMQVLLFTHHERVADQAADAIGNDKLRVQLLSH